MLSRFLIFLGCLLAVQPVGAAPFTKGDIVYLCLKHPLHQAWPEIFAYQVRILEVGQKRVKVRVVDNFPSGGRVNEEQTPVIGDVMKISKRKIHTKDQAGVSPGPGFHGKPLCKNLM